MARRRRRQRFAPVALRVIFIYLAVFSAAQMILCAVTGFEQTELISQTFLVFGIECGGLLFKRIAEKLFVKQNKEEDCL